MMRHCYRIWTNHWGLIIPLVLKLALHLFAIGHYGFHRDEFLYLVQGDHLQWGYLEVPPFIALVGKIATLIFGNSLTGIRLFPLAGSIGVLWLIGRMVRSMGGSNRATLLAGLAFLVSPVFLRTGLLFQPVVFDQLCWTLVAWWILRLLKQQDKSYWIGLGVTIGVAVLVKYTIAFYVLSFVIATLITPAQQWWRRPGIYLAALIALVIAFPNLLWQYNHNFPIVFHMEELSRTQLVNVGPFDFLMGQVVMHGSATLVWLAGLIFVFRHEGAKYRIFGWSFLFTLLLLLFLSGKIYYTNGAYPVLLALGGVALEYWLKAYGQWILWGLVAVLVLLGGAMVPYGIPVLNIKSMLVYADMMDHRLGLESPLIWEDGVKRTLPQDYADMFGWEEMVAKTARVYHDLDSATQARTIIYGGSYAHTATVNFYRQRYRLPEAVSMNNSFLLWAPEDLDFDTQIELDDGWQTQARYFESLELMDSIENPYAREPGYIYLKSEPKVNVPDTWNQLLKEARSRFTKD